MANAFKAGDVVQLKSGGPPMTVNHAPNDYDTALLYDCVWFKGASKEYAKFLEHVLVAYEPPKK